PEPLDVNDEADEADEDEIWARLVAAYGEQPDPETGRWPATGGDTAYDAPGDTPPGGARSDGARSGDARPGDELPRDERKGPVKEAPDPALPEQDQPNLSLIHI
ncbi:hypothetical protein ADK38_47695, partial [Streptomyces varsoviensis]